MIERLSLIAAVFGFSGLAAATTATAADDPANPASSIEITVAP